MRFRLALAGLAALSALPADAQQFQGMQSDQNLNFALQDMLNAFGYACQTLGDQNACNGYNYVQGAANYMVGASDACLQGNTQACDAYGSAYAQMSATYQSYAQAAYAGQAPDPSGQLPAIDPAGGGGPAMGAIGQWGADNSAGLSTGAGEVVEGTYGFNDYISE